MFREEKRTKNAGASRETHPANWDYATVTILSRLIKRQARWNPMISPDLTARLARALEKNAGRKAM